jgi:5-methylcytosine-specific restriction endonuclease McrA
MTHYNYTEEQIQGIISSCHSWNEVLQKLDMKTLTRSLQRRIKNSGICCDNLNLKNFDGLHTKFNKFSKDKIVEIIQNHSLWNNVLNEFGYKTCNHIPTIKKKLDLLNIDYSHLKLTETNRNIKYTLDEILIEDSPYTKSAGLLKRLKKERGWDHNCSICKLSAWNGKPIPLELDHIDGCHTNNTYTNLRAICPNCHAQTDTYKGKNMKSYKENKLKNPSPIEPKIKVQRVPKLCIGCSKEINSRNIQCNTCRAQSMFESGQFRKVERPSLEQLQEDLRESSMVQVGKKYGVSDNTIRKWLKQYDKYSS